MFPSFIYGCTRQSLQCACAVAIFCTARLFWDVPLAGAHAGTLAGTHAGTLVGAHAGTLAGAYAGTLTGTRNWSGCSSNCWAVTTTPQILEAGRPRPQGKGVPGHLPGQTPGQTPGHLPGQTLGQKLGILTLIPFHNATHFLGSLSIVSIISY